MLPRYTSQHMANVWNEYIKYMYWLSIEKAIIEYLVKKGSMPNYLLELMSHINIDSLMLKDIANREEKIKHDVLAFVEIVCENMEDLRSGSSAYFHRGLTSSDIVDTALALQLTKAHGFIMSALYGLIKAVETKIAEYQNVSIIGRTHGQIAELTTIGQKFGMWINGLYRAKERLELAREHISVGKLSGPVGMRRGDIDFKDEQEILKNLGLKAEPTADQIVQRDRHSFYVATLAITASSLENFATEIRLLSFSEIGEIREGHSVAQRGSSSMPAKENPIACENICGLARVVRGFVSVALENQTLWLERDISHSSAERYMFPIITATIETMLLRMTTIVDNLYIDKDIISNNVIFAENKLYTGIFLYHLQKNGVSRNSAYNLVETTQAICRGLEESFIYHARKYILNNFGNISEENFINAIKIAQNPRY